MFNLLIYLGHSALCLVALYIIYKAAMSNETMHRLNRVVLLSIVALSALLPLCEIKIKEEVEAEWVEYNNFYIPDSETMATTEVVVAEPETETEPFDYLGIIRSVAIGLFLLGVAFMLVRLVASTLSVWRMVQSGRVEHLENDVTLTVVDNLASPFSYFGHIVVAESDLKENRDLILAHELAHIRLYHSWDILFVDLVLCVWWFNPAMWLLRRELQSLHEYQADNAVLNSGVDAKTYQLLLIKRAVGSRLHSVANCLNHSNLKNRITMMCKKKSSKWAAAKLLLVLPLVALSLAATATTVYVTVDNIDERKVMQNSPNNQTQSRFEERIFDTEVPQTDKYKLSPVLNENFALIPAETAANTETQQREKREIKGKIVDEYGKPVAGVVVLIKKSPFGSMTDNDGQFAGLKVTDADILEISHVAYERQEVPVKGKKFVNIVLKTKVYTEEQVVVTSFHAGYNHDKKKQTENSSTQEVATIKVVSNNEFLYNGKPYDQIGLAKVLESYNKETINVQVGENAHYTQFLDEILRRVVKRVDYQRVNIQKVVDDIELQKSIINYFHRAIRSLRNDECAVGVVYVYLTVGRTGVVTIEKTSAQSKSEEVASYLQKKVEFRLKQHPMVFIEEKIEEPQSIRLEIVFAKKVDGLLGVPNAQLSKDAIYVIGEDTSSQKENKGDDVVVGLNQSKTAPVSSNNDDDEEQPLMKAEILPSFQGGSLDGYQHWVESQIEYPKKLREKGVGGRVTVEFVVEKDGSVTFSKILQSPHELFSKEVERVMKSSPKWSPGKQRGEPVTVKMQMKVNFQVNEFLPTQVKGITKYGYDEPLEKAEKMPSFMGGGMDKFTAWAQSKLEFPMSARKAGIDKGKIIATFIVEKDGSVSSRGVMSTLPNGKAFADEALRVIELSPKWEPGSNNGNPVRVKCSVTFKFAEYKRKLIAKVVNN